MNTMKESDKWQVSKGIEINDLIYILRLHQKFKILKRVSPKTFFVELILLVGVSDIQEMLLHTVILKIHTNDDI